MKKTAIIWTLAAGLAWAIPSDIAWITHLPGVSVASETQVHGAEHVVLSMHGDPQATWDALKAGLARHEWSVLTSANVDAGAVTTHSLTASHSGHSLQVAVSDIPGFGPQLAVSYDTGGESEAPSGGGKPEASSGETRVGSNYSVNGNNNSQSLQCDHTESLDVNGNNNHLDCHGQCVSLNVNGNNNTIVLRGSVTTVNLLGNDNVIKWSQAANAKQPSFNQMGVDNIIEKF